MRADHGRGARVSRESISCQRGESVSRLFPCTIVVMSSLAVATLPGCALEDLPANSSEADEPLGSHSQEVRFRLHSAAMVVGPDDHEDEVGRMRVWYDPEDPSTLSIAVDYRGFAAVPRSAAVAVGDDLSALPSNPAGCPAVGKFPHRVEDISGDHVEIDVDISRVRARNIVLSVHNRIVSTVGGRSESAWGDGPNFPGCPSTARYFEVTLPGRIPGNRAELER